MDLDRTKPIRLSKHAEARCLERGTSPEEVAEAVRHGQATLVREGRWMVRLTIEAETAWQGVRYRVKQVAPIVVEGPLELVVVTAMTFFF